MSNTSLPNREAIARVQKDIAASLDEYITNDMQDSVLPLTLAHDGWSNVNKVHVMNVLAFLKSDTTSRATAEVLFDLLSNTIDDLIEKKILVSSVVADNASVNSKMGRMIQKQYPWITMCCSRYATMRCQNV